MTSLPDKMVRLHQSLARHELPHAFGGALALAWCTERARGTIDIDLNVFIPASRAEVLRGGLPPEVTLDDDLLHLLERDGQARLFWDETPVDLFLNTTRFHEDAARRARWEPFAGHDLPFLGCDDLAVFKAFFNRTKDWADLEAMVDAGTLDIDRVVGVIVHHLGATDERIGRLERLRA